MKAALRYFSGTGNSYRVALRCAERLRVGGYEAEEACITRAGGFPTEARLVGFCFPVYAFALPRIARKYLQALPRADGATKAFLIMTAGRQDEAGNSLSEGVRLLAKKNYAVVYADVIEMPANWTVAMNPPGREDAARIRETGLAKADAIVEAILAGRSFIRGFTYPSRISKARYYWDHWSFKYVGLANLWRSFTTDADCTGCGTCHAVCPVGSITMAAGRPVWSAACEQCMRCVNMCSRKAISQKGYGSTKHRNHYMDALFERKITAEFKERALQGLPGGGFGPPG